MSTSRRILTFWSHIVATALLLGVSNTALGNELDSIVDFLTTYTQQSTPKFESQIRKYFARKTLEQTQQAIQILETRIGREASAEKIRKSLTSFSKLHPQPLRENIVFYEGFIGAEGVNTRLKKSFSGFEADAPTLDGVVHVLLNQDNPGSPFLTRDEISERMRRDLQSFASTNAEKLQGVIDVLLNQKDPNNPFLTHKEISERMRQDLLGFAKTNAEKLQGVIGVLLNQGNPGSPFLTHNEISERMRRDLSGFAGTNVEKLHGVLDVLLNQKDPNNPFLTHKEISERMQRDLNGFARTNAEKLQGVIGVLLNQDNPGSPFLTHKEISERMRQDLQSFASTNAKKLKGLIDALLKNGLSQQDIRQLFLQAPHGALSLTARRVSDVTSLAQALHFAHLNERWVSQEEKLRSLMTSSLTHQRIEAATKLHVRALQEGSVSINSPLKVHHQRFPQECQAILSGLIRP